MVDMNASHGDMIARKKGTRMRILIIEDDIRLAQALERILQENGYIVDAVHDGPSGRDWAVVGPYDVIVCDVMLPGMDGFEVVRAIRHAGVNTPILMLTAKSAVADRIAGLDHGADDYMTKPFSPAELMAHLRALTRRQTVMVFESIEAGDLSLKLESHDLACGDKSIHLSKREFSLAKILFANKSRIVSKETIIDKVWGPESNADDNNVEAYISFLRKKLRFLESATTIETVRKVGYRLSPSVRKNDEEA